MKWQGGFTLTELAIAFFIIGLLLASAFMPLASQLEVRNIADTRRTMDQIKEAIIGFAQANGRLPCPARGATRTGDTDATTYSPQSFSSGIEQYDSTNKRCFTVVGVIPWSTLGVAETDAWGRRFTYRVSPAFADATSSEDASKTTWQSRSTTPVGTANLQILSTPASPGDQSPDCPISDESAAPTPTPTQSSFALCTRGDIVVLTRDDLTNAVNVLGSGLPVVIISHGKNGNGAWQSNGVALASAVANSDELTNSANTDALAAGLGARAQYTTGGVTYWAMYSRTQSQTTRGCDDAAATTLCEFDDAVTMISANTLVARMVSAGRLP